NAFFLNQSPSLDKLQAAYGAGVRWHSPFGPIAVDIAIPINPRPKDQHTVFDFGAAAPLLARGSPFDRGRDAILHGSVRHLHGCACIEYSPKFTGVAGTGSSQRPPL